MFGVSFPPTVHNPASALTARSLVLLVATLALVSAPLLGVAWADARPGQAGDAGAVAGVMPLVADPGHRMGGATTGTSTPSGVAEFATTTSWVDGSDVRPAESVVGGADHDWLERMLSSARQQTDGG